MNRNGRDEFRRAHSLAVQAWRQAYAPYSKFRVGSAVLTDVGVFTGCNVENASYGATICAERIAILKAVSEGARKILGIVVVTDQKKLVPPCALCLQVIAEFGEAKAPVWLGDLTKLKKKYLFKDLLTHPFGPSFLKKKKNRS